LISSAWTKRVGGLSPREIWAGAGPGILVCAIVAIAAQFLSDHYGAPAMLMALLLGMALGFLGEEGRCVEGIDFSAKTVMRFGVAVLGARISVDLLASLGPAPVVLVMGAVVATILFGLLGARTLGRGWRLALLTGGSVAICGVSAAMAIAAVLPRNENSERNLTFTVISVAVLSTLAMILYPILAEALAFDARASGVFLGGTIHDVAQVVGAGFSISDETGETATVIKLIRVTMLAPVVLVLSVALRGKVRASAASPRHHPPLVPGFVIAFLLLAAANSLALLPGGLTEFLAVLSRWALLVAIAAVGMKTSIARILDVGGKAVALIVAETLFIMALVLTGIRYLV
jgi:uncharacterized integral membrane protein (TIGR00698 family)